MSQPFCPPHMKIIWLVHETSQSEWEINIAFIEYVHLYDSSHLQYQPDKFLYLLEHEVKLWIAPNALTLRGLIGGATGPPAPPLFLLLRVRVE